MLPQTGAGRQLLALTRHPHWQVTATAAAVHNKWHCDSKQQNSQPNCRL